MSKSGLVVGRRSRRRSTRRRRRRRSRSQIRQMSRAAALMWISDCSNVNWPKVHPTHLNWETRIDEPKSTCFESFYPSNLIWSGSSCSTFYSQMVDNKYLETVSCPFVAIYLFHFQWTNSSCEAGCRALWQWIHQCQSVEVQLLRAGGLESTVGLDLKSTNLWVNLSTEQ